MGVVKTASESILEETVMPSEEANYSQQGYAEEWSENFPYQLLIAAGVALVGLVLLAAVSFQCSSTWRWIMNITRHENVEDTETDQIQQNAIRISHSLPDLQSEPITHEYVQEQKDNKKVLRQTTLPIVPMRHQSFQRQLSHRLDLPNIKFSICSFENRSDSSLGLIKPELYKKELVRQESAESSSTTEMEYAGKLHFALRYDKEIEGLVVKVLEARELPIKDVTGSSDPYVKVYLLPDRKKKFQTKVHRKNLNPIFNETFIFSVSYEELRERYLQFSVYDFDRFSRHDLIGQVVLKGLLDCTDLEQEIEYTMDILCALQEKVDLGELMLSLCYLPTAGRLTLTVVKARNLKGMDITGKSDPYVKVYLLCQGKRIKKKKTTVKKNTLYPIYNEALVFDVPSDNIEDVSLIVKVIDYDRIGSNELMGCTAIGSSFIGIGRDHWLEMLDTPRKPVAQWYPLMETVAGHIPAVDSESLPVSLSCLNRVNRLAREMHKAQNDNTVVTEYYRRQYCSNYKIIDHMFYDGNTIQTKIKLVILPPIRDQASSSPSLLAVKVITDDTFILKRDP
ncbi:PREDICTED: synaptotagmin-6-like [Atta cephalotes]|uniref:C2 domain-containing protein n=1 Tax=Atta cephalotes TaxID=12957 RepID=A0A158N9T6_ATTCE|nr:PREDICTED: synaptotagmin-6-like [Atta cephalotes]